MLNSPMAKADKVSRVMIAFFFVTENTTRIDISKGPFACELDIFSVAFFLFV